MLKIAVSIKEKQDVTNIGLYCYFLPHGFPFLSQLKKQILRLRNECSGHLRWTDYGTIICRIEKGQDRPRKVKSRGPVRGVSGVSIETPRILEISTAEPHSVFPRVKNLIDTPNCIGIVFGNPSTNIPHEAFV